jgi:signal transduction histidine kinase
MERGLQFLAELSQLERSPERFLVEGAGALARLPWVSGVEWRAGGATGSDGDASTYTVEFQNSNVTLRIHSRYRMSPALHWHLHLLALLLAEFYLAKLREAELHQASYLQAVHETGARMTHDIKNLLQSLSVLTAAASREENDSPELRALLRRQLPVITQRLAETLEKLKRPEPAAEDYAEARSWWQSLGRQYRGEGVQFDDGPSSGGFRVPRSVFDTVADNLIRNALAKRASDEATRVHVSLRSGADGVTLRVRDTGTAIEGRMAAALLHAPVPSPAGLGIGLYQAARLSESRG